MSSHLASLLTLKVNVLKSLAVSIGVNSSGTKAQLAARITKSCEGVGFFDRSLGINEEEQGDKGEEAVGHRMKGQAGERMKRVLSIDMGIRNLAMCVIEVPNCGVDPTVGKEGRSSKSRKKTVTGALPKVIAWESIAVAERPPAAPEEPEDPNSEIGTTTTKRSRQKNLVKTRKVRKKVESFDPANYAILANKFARTILSRFSPDAILIERQRYRSHGGSGILEWTLRVNMFEAMLHAVFYSVGDTGEGNARRESPAAESVPPDKVSRFWIKKAGEKYLEVQTKRKKSDPGLGEEGLGKIDKDMGIEVKKRTSDKAKLAKISLVCEWIKGGDVLSLDKRVACIVNDFIPAGRERKVSKTVNGKKLDDLADCLLQGMAWIRWEENRRDLAEGKVVSDFLTCNKKES